MKVACYVRVSSDEQVQEGYSIAAQRERLTAYCISQQWEISEFYIEEGVSAKDMNRPELQRMLSNAQNGSFDVVLVYRLDRLTRSVMDLYSLLELFERSGVKFKSATELYDTTTAMGKLFITLVAALAEWERNNLSERVRFGMEQLVREGKWHGGPVPFGYTWDGTKMEVVEEEAKVCRELRRFYMDNNGFYTTAKHLNALGYTRRGFKWSSQSVWYVLDNPFYAGKVRWGGKKRNGKYASRKKEEMVDCIIVNGDQPPIFTWEEYEDHRKKMDRRAFSGYSKKREYWFTGILKCSRCGANMTGRPYHNTKKDGSKSANMIYYICGNKQNGTGCTMPMVRQEIVAMHVMEYIKRIKIDHDRVKEMEGTIKQEVNDLQSEIDHVQKELKRIQERKKKWQYMFVEELIDEPTYRERKREEEEVEELLNNQLDDLRARNVGANLSTLNLMFELPELWNVLDDKEKNEMIQTIFLTIELYCPVEKAVARKGKVLPFSIKSVSYN